MYIYLNSNFTLFNIIQQNNELGRECQARDLHGPNFSGIDQAGDIHENLKKIHKKKKPGPKAN